MEVKNNTTLADSAQTILLISDISNGRELQNGQQQVNKENGTALFAGPTVPNDKTVTDFHQELTTNFPSELMAKAKICPV